MITGVISVCKRWIYRRVKTRQMALPLGCKPQILGGGWLDETPILDEGRQIKLVTRNVDKDQNTYYVNICILYMVYMYIVYIHTLAYTYIHYISFQRDVQ